MMSTTLRESNLQPLDRNSDALTIRPTPSGPPSPSQLQLPWYIQKRTMPIRFYMVFSISKHPQTPALFEHGRPSHFTAVIHSFCSIPLGMAPDQHLGRLQSRYSDLHPAICQRRSDNQLFKRQLKSYFNSLANLWSCATKRLSMPLIQAVLVCLTAAAHYKCRSTYQP